MLRLTLLSTSWRFDRAEPHQIVSRDVKISQSFMARLRAGIILAMPSQAPNALLESVIHYYRGSAAELTAPKPRTPPHHSRLFSTPVSSEP